MSQNEITTCVNLLDSDGCVLNPGYAKVALFKYDRKMIKANKLRIKEWDYYCVLNNHFGIALTIADNSYMGLDSITLFDFDQRTEITQSFMQGFTLGNKHLPSSSNENVKVKYKTHSIHFYVQDKDRILEFDVKNFKDNKSLSGKLVLSDSPDESMVIATPFDKPKYFYYNQKINCMRVEGEVQFGSKKFVFNKEDSFGVLDWGRGVWTYSNTWYWGSASGLVNNKPFGFNIGYGFGNTQAATENMLIYAGKAHKLNDVLFNIPKDEQGNEKYLEPWTFTSNDHRFELKFEPILDRSSNTKVLVLQSDQHQVFGYFSGTVILDNGEELSITKLLGFAEKVMNRW
jgi:hypothetical protein